MADAAAVATPTDGGAQPGTQDAAPQQTTADTGQKAAETPAAQPQTPAAPRTYERKVNGKVEKLPADEIDKAAKLLGLEPSDLLRGTQLAKAAYEKFEAARKMEQQYSRYKDLDPWQIAREVKGLKDEDLDGLAEQRLIEKLKRDAELSQLTPEQQAYEKQRVEFERQKSEFEARQKEAQEQQMARDSEAYRAQMEPVIIAEMEKAGMPKTPAAVRAVVEQLKTQHKYNIPLDFAAAVRDAQETFINPSAAILAKMGPEAIIKAIGQDAYEALLRHSLSQKTTPGTKPAEQPKEQPREQPRSWMTSKEWTEAYLK